MAVEIKVPTLGESVTEATIAKWFKKVGDAVKADEPMCELETDKVTVEVPAPATGMLSAIIAEAGTTVAVGAKLGEIEAGAVGKVAAPAAAAAPAAKAAPAPAPAPAAAAAQAGPAARKALSESGLNPASVAGTGKDGRITKPDAASRSHCAAPRSSAARPAAGSRAG